SGRTLMTFGRDLTQIASLTAGQTSNEVSVSVKSVVNSLARSATTAAAGGQATNNGVAQSVKTLVMNEQSGLARISLGVDKFTEIVFNREPNHISNVQVSMANNHTVTI